MALAMAAISSMNSDTIARLQTKEFTRSSGFTILDRDRIVAYPMLETLFTALNIYELPLNVSLFSTTINISY